MSGGTSGSDDGDEDGPRPGKDPRDFAAVYETNRDRLRRIAAASLRGPQRLESHAEDVVQKAITELWAKYQETGQVPADWFAFMVTAVKRRAIDLMRSGYTKYAGASLNNPDTSFEPADPDDFAEDHATEETVKAALDSLEDNQQREVLRRIFYQDQTQAQVAKELGLTPGRITQIKQEALKKLAARLDDEWR